MASLRDAVGPILRERDEIDARLTDPQVLKDPRQLRVLGRRRQEVQRILDLAEIHNSAREDLVELEEVLTGDDPDLRTIAREEIDGARLSASSAREALEDALLPPDPDGHRNAILEIRAGTGGDEAALWVGDLFGMYKGTLEGKRFRLTVLSSSPNEMGGYKEIVSLVKGRGAYGWLAGESGIHRVQRVPATESQGRIHTSAATVAVLPEADEEVEVEIDPKDLVVDTYRASGAGGQHVNKTDSAVRITHRPSGIVVQCQEERSQHQNRERCMMMIRSRIYQNRLDQRKAEGDEARRSAVGRGDRSEKIRTYNFPQSRITDHRVGVASHRLEGLLAGELPSFFEEVAHALRHQRREKGS